MTKPIAIALIGAGVLLALTFALKRNGVDATRTMEIIIGLGLGFYANFIPKNVAAAHGPRTQAALRLSGYAFMLAGLGFAAAWAFLPLAAAFPLSMAVVGSALAVSLSYTVWACTRRA